MALPSPNVDFANVHREGYNVIRPQISDELRGRLPTLVYVAPSLPSLKHVIGVFATRVFAGTSPTGRNVDKIAVILEGEAFA